MYFVFYIKRGGREEIALRKGLTLQEEQNAILNLKFPSPPPRIVTRGVSILGEGEGIKVGQKKKE